MVNNTDLEIAIEIIAAKIATYSRTISNIIDDEMKNLLKERDKVYMGDEEIIKKFFLYMDQKWEEMADMENKATTLDDVKAKYQISKEVQESIGKK